MEVKAGANVSVIPATKRSVRSGAVLKTIKELRVAAYCRVSTGNDEQQSSYIKQKEYYTKLITSKEGWQFAGIYADEAITGTSRAHRKEFNRMIDDAVAGKIDYIVTKSISRFARNTVDTLECVRQLRQLSPPVGIFFEKENIDTLDSTGELFLTILSAMAQDESRSIGDNVRWSIQKNFQQGKPTINLERMLGYDLGEDGSWMINEQQSETVKEIYNQSMSTKGVLRGLHFQKQYPQTKLVRAIKGSVYDVAVNLRSGSKTYGKWFGVLLTEENKKQFLIPRGFAHGFLVLSETAEFCYKCDDFYHANDEGGLAWNDPEIGIDWASLGVKGE